MELKGKALKLFNQHKHLFNSEDELIELIEKYVETIYSKYNTWKYLSWVIHEASVYYGDIECDQVFDAISFFHENQDLYTIENLNVTGLTIKNNSPKDITNYTLSVLLIANQKIESVKRFRENKKALKSDVCVVYDDDDYQIIVPYTWEASKYWGINTKWCTTMKDDPTHFNRYSNNGSLFYVLDKRHKDNPSHPFGRFALFISNNYSNQHDAQAFNAPDQQLVPGMSTYLPPPIVNTLMLYHNSGGFTREDLDSFTTALITEVIESCDFGIDLNNHFWFFMKTEDKSVFKVVSESFSSYYFLLTVNNKTTNSMKTLGFDFTLNNLTQTINKKRIETPIQKFQIRNIKNKIINGDIVESFVGPFFDQIEDSIVEGVEQIVITLLNSEIEKINGSGDWRFILITNYTTKNKSVFSGDSNFKLEFTNTNPTSCFYNYKFRGYINLTQNTCHLSEGTTLEFEWNAQQMSFVMLYRNESGFQSTINECLLWFTTKLEECKSRKIRDVYDDNIKQLTKMKEQSIDEILLGGSNSGDKLLDFFNEFEDDPFFDL